MKAKLVRIGNSRGIRLPKPVIEEAGLSDEVVLEVRERSVVITSVSEPRAGWAEAARAMKERRNTGLLDAPTSTRFDEGEWEW